MGARAVPSGKEGDFIGTSSVKRRPRRRKRGRGRRPGGGGGSGDGDRGDSGESVDWVANTAEAAEKVDRVLKEVLPLLPNGSAKTPIYIGATETLYFAYKWREGGLEHAIRESGRRIGKEYVVPFVVDRSWAEVAKRMPASPLSRYAEGAYKRTMTQILEKGVDALADYRRTEEPR